MNLRDARSLPTTLLALAVLGAVPVAQTGPFADGELVLYTPLSNPAALWRIDPTTGDSALLTQGLSGGGLPGWLTYDPHRGGVVASATFPTIGFLHHLVRVDAGGSLADLGFNGIPLRALSAVGDGRIYFQRYQQVAPFLLEVLDANDQVHVLTDSTTGTPVDVEAGFSLYVPQQNALLVATEEYSFACGPGSVRVSRVPLSANGLQVNGPITCSTWDLPFQFEHVNGLDRLPNGNALLAVSHGYVGSDTLVEVDPSGPTLSPWAQTTQGDLDGLAWSTRLGRAVVVDDFFNTLRLFDKGHVSGPGLWGATLTTNITATIGGGQGLSSGTTLIDVNLHGGGCSGLSFTYGTGHGGTGAVVPAVGLTNCPRLGQSTGLALSKGRGGAAGLFVYGSAQAAIPLYGGTLLVAPPLASVVFVLGGAAGVPAAGSTTIPVLLPNNPALSGVPYFGQAGILDPQASHGVALTPGLELRPE